MVCPNCNTDAGNSNFCPNCGADLSGTATASKGSQKDTPKKKKKGCLLSFIIILVFFGVATAIFSSIGPTVSTPNSGSGDANGVGSADLELLDYDSITEGGLRYVVGHIRNNTSKTYSYVQVSINLYNGDTQVGSTLANVNNLEPGSTWEFKALIFDDSANQYKISEITGF